MTQIASPSGQLQAAHIEMIRGQFPGLHRSQNSQPIVFLDGPAGTQVPSLVAGAVSQHLLHHNANHGGPFATSRESDAIVDEAHRAVADLLGTSDPEETIFGGNMTTLTMHLSRALAREWTATDEIIVTRLDHDANVRPWVLAAQDAGAKVHFVPVREADCTLDLDAYRSMLNENTKLVAVGAASNSVGTVNPIREMVDAAHQVGAEVFVDAVHYAPHRAIDVNEWNCDFLACSAYKFFGPHIGILWGRRRRLEQLSPYKLNPAPNELPGRWMTGTQNFACIAGTLAAINYIADLGRSFESNAGLVRREALLAAFNVFAVYEQQLVWRLISGLSAIAQLKIYGILQEERASERMPTISLTSTKRTPKQLAETLSTHGICAWHGNYYAWELSHFLNREPEGMLRLGLVHYNTLEEVDRTIAAMEKMHR